MTNLSISITHRDASGERSIDISTYSDSPLPVNGNCQVIDRAAEPQAVAAPSLEWSNTLCAGERVDYAAAEKACTELGEGWRLPTRVELLSLVDDTRYDPAIDTERFPDTRSGAYWAGTEYKGVRPARGSSISTSAAPTTAPAATTSPSCARSGRCRPVSNSASLPNLRST
ncbi:DUF1566 domain-containing protein [Lysobacter enzymogenes]|uniref:Lcl C-terminal domain-containing protein n=1 Tax=Lysobacter enzymogenes TaxID=69 RepID=UPI0022655A4F|nr:DUF1566 domain-containing protein [Lysobacter enzymogenes]UZW62725.1 DUF1566 domain-containing protein [Lysobacter enzymogenes]